MRRECGLKKKKKKANDGSKVYELPQFRQRLRNRDGAFGIAF
jgi:hypothetical protein